MASDRYFIKTGESAPWQEVSKRDYVNAERMAGFYNTMGRPYEPATAGYSNGSMRGRLCYDGKGLPENFVPLKESHMDPMMTPQQFHAELVKKFNKHCEDVRKGKEKEFSFLADEGIEYNEWIEHRHGWAVTEDLLCGVSLSSLDDSDDLASGQEVPFEDCNACYRLVELYRDYCSKYRVERARSLDRALMELENE